MKLIGMDVGGTFTDVVYADIAQNRTLIHKVPTTAQDPSEGVIRAILQLCANNDIPPAKLDHVYHGKTIAMNAFVGPQVRNYAGRVERAMEDARVKADLHIMRSNGGVATRGMTVETPVLTLLSGPAAGVLGGAWAGALSDRKGVISFDIDGTSTDIGVVTDGAVHRGHGAGHLDHRLPGRGAHDRHPHHRGRRSFSRRTTRRWCPRPAAPLLMPTATWSSPSVRRAERCGGHRLPAPLRPTRDQPVTPAQHGGQP